MMEACISICSMVDNNVSYAKEATQPGTSFVGALAEDIGETTDSVIEAYQSVPNKRLRLFILVRHSHFTLPKSVNRDASRTLNVAPAACVVKSGILIRNAETSCA